MLSHRDAKDLKRYYYLAGRAQRSIQGPMLERMAMMGVACRKPVGEITARPTAEVREEPRTEFDEELIETFGRVSTRLRTMPVRMQRVLEAFHGDDGECCEARMKRYGRIVSVFAMTEAGKSILKHEKRIARKRGGERFKVSEVQLMQNAVSASDAEPSTTDADIVRAHVQALALLEQAEDAYTKATAQTIPDTEKLRGMDVLEWRRRADRPRRVLRGLRKVVG